MSKVEHFGQTEDGEAVHRIAIEGGGLAARIMTSGAAIQDLRLEGHAPPLVLGFERFEDYALHSPFFGEIVGRYANRIANGRATIGGRSVQLDRNFLGRHLLHGGARGIGKRVWTIGDSGPDFVVMRLLDRDGEMGFPGNLDITCTYRLGGEGVLSVTLDAASDAPTLCNLAHHSYFNLDDGGAGTILDHTVTIDADAYLPVDNELIPTGEIAPVDSTPFDFRTARQVAAGGLEQAGFDHNWCLARSRRPLARAARFEAARSGVAMEVWTGEPGLQFYAGENVACAVPGLEGRRYGAFSGACFEAQVWPDAPNRPDFPQANLAPGETSRQVTEYRFSKG